MDHVSRGQAFLAANRTHTKHKHWRVAYVIRPRCVCVCVCVYVYVCVFVYACKCIRDLIHTCVYE
jgi:hypothetical protein